MRRTVMLMVALATSPALAEAQDLTDCLAADPGDQREDVVDGYVFWDIDLRNDCTEEVHANWYYYAPFARDPAFPMAYYTQPVRPGNLIRVTLSWEIAEYGREPPTPVIAWCGHRAYADYARCRGSNDYERGSRVNWREWPARSAGSPGFERAGARTAPLSGPLDPDVARGGAGPAIALKARTCSAASYAVLPTWRRLVIRLPVLARRVLS